MQNDNNIKVLNFESGNLHGAVDLARVHKIIALPKLNPINDAPFYVVGLMNYSGKIVPIIDMVMRAEDKDPERYRINTPIILCDTAKGKLIGLLVNKVIDITNVSQSMMEKCELNKSKMISTTIKYGEKIVSLIDIDYVIPEEMDHKGEDNE